MIRKKIKAFILLALSGSTISTAFASSTHFFDHDIYTTDSLSGLDWLDVTRSENRSFDDISNQLESGGEFDGWRYATTDEFNTMVSDYTDDTYIYSEFGRNHYENGIIDTLVSLLGDTYANFAPSDSLLSFTSGMLIDMNYGGQLMTAMLWDDDNPYIDDSNPDRDDPSGYDYSDPIYRMVYGGDTLGISRGSYLVRDTTEIASTPLPASVWLMISGVLGVMGFSRKNKTPLTT
jgi:hypothetical protein